MKSVLTQDQLNSVPVFDDTKGIMYTNAHDTRWIDTGERVKPGSGSGFMATWKPFMDANELRQMRARSRDLRRQALGGEA